MSRHLMLLPSLDCPANCAYCFGPHRSGSQMHSELIEHVVQWQKTLDNREALEITFHGGEPLLLGAKFYCHALPYLRHELAPRRVTFTAQSNLWPLNNELCELFREYRISFGTSLDGPESINDAQRGTGYFKRTMSGIELARKHGISVGCICTFTSQSLTHATEIFEFFAREGLDFSIHAAVPALNSRINGGCTLSPKAYGDLLAEMLDLYLANLERMCIPFLDSLCRSVSAGKSSLCTFSDCLGDYLAVGPEGHIYACQRFAGLPQYSLGRVQDIPSQAALSAEPVWQDFRKQQDEIKRNCGDCPHVMICRGGCPYNAAADKSGSLRQGRRDPYCTAYKKIFETITDRAISEVFSEENLNAVVEKGGHTHGLLRKGRLLQLMRGGPHPRLIVHQARKTAMAVALGAMASAEEAAEKLKRLGCVTRSESALASLTALQEQLLSESQGLVNNYIHISYLCSLACRHCYAKAGPNRTDKFMETEAVMHLIKESARARFTKAVITGGEPLEHPQIDAILNILLDMRSDVKPMETVLRTNLVHPLTASLIEGLAHSTDQVVVSLDGNEACHDARRGLGTYVRTTTNLRRLIEANPSASVSVTAVLTNKQTKGTAGDSIRGLAEELGIRARFKPIFPIGRAESLSLSPEYYSSVEDDWEDDDKFTKRLHLAATCGLGMNLSIAPDGECSPCYALLGDNHRLGNVFEIGLPGILDSAKYHSFKRVTVDSNRLCHRCALRYLCGGFCRAWRIGENSDAPPIECGTLFERALNLLLCALDSLNISPQCWQEAGLPLPKGPPKLEKLQINLNP